MPAARATAAQEKQEREKQNRPQGVSVTIKTGKGYEDTWLGFTGSVEEVRANLKATFELDDTDLTLFELVQNATQAAHGVTTAVKGLGGKVASSAPSAPANDEAQASKPDAWSQVEQEKASESTPVDPYDALDAAVQEFTDAAELKKFYATNKDLFTAGTERSEASKKAWQAKGRALSKKT